VLASHDQITNSERHDDENGACEQQDRAHEEQLQASAEPAPGQRRDPRNDDQRGQDRETRWTQRRGKPERHTGPENGQPLATRRDTGVV